MTRTTRRAIVVAGLAVALVPVLATGSASAMFTQLEVVSLSTESSSQAKQKTVYCPSGKRVVGVGATMAPTGLAGHVLIDAIRPNDALTRVTVRAREDETGTSNPWSITAYAVCAAPPAGMELRTATTSATSADKSATVGCPTGKRLLGLGGEITSANGQVLLEGLVPNAGLTKGRVNAVEDETGNSGTWTVTAYGICSAPVAGLDRSSATGPPQSESEEVTSARCPRGKALISAAGTIDSPNGQVVLSQVFPHLSQATAEVRAAEDDTGNAEDWTLTAYAICAASAELETRTVSPLVTDFRAVGEHCAAGRRPTGFAGEVTGALGQVWLRGLWREDEFLATAAADETGASPPWSLKAHGICATTVPDAELVVAQSSLSSETLRSVVATCPAGLSVLGAGARVQGAEREVVLTRIRPESTLTSVSGLAREDATGATGDWRLYTFALCAPPPAGLERVQDESGFSTDELATAVAVCPAGKHLIGTGAEIESGAGRVGFDDVRPDADLTRTRITATVAEGADFDAMWNAIAYSICIDR